MHIGLTSPDRQLEELLRACGVRVTVLALEKLDELAQASARVPDILIIDQRERTSIPAAVAAIRRQHPSTGILLVLGRLDPALMLDAMRAGVTECVADPVTQDDLLAAIRRIGSQGPAARDGDVFAIVGAKGGVGATTLAVNLATMLSKLRSSGALLIDLHPTYGDAAVFLAAEPRFSLMDALENTHRLDGTFLRSLVTPTKSGIDILASSDRPAPKPVDAAHVKRLIEVAASLYPYVVLDAPRVDPVVLDSLESARAIVVVANQEVATVRSASRLSTGLKERYGHERVSIVMTRYDDRADIDRRAVERVIGQPVKHVFPNNYPITLASLNAGRPLVLDNHSKLAGAFTAFAHALAGIPADDAGNNGSSGFFGLIGRRR